MRDDDKFIIWTLLGGLALGLIVFALLFLTSCGPPRNGRYVEEWSERGISVDTEGFAVNRPQFRQVADYLTDFWRPVAGQCVEDALDEMWVVFQPKPFKVWLGAHESDPVDGWLWARARLSLVGFLPDLWKTGLAHELSHAILYICDGREGEYDLTATCDAYHLDCDPYIRPLRPKVTVDAGP